MVAVICMGLVNVAMADSCNNHTFVLQGAGIECRWYNAERHKAVPRQIQVCSKCGVTGSYEYDEKNAGFFPHIWGSTVYNYHSGDIHYFYEICNDCKGRHTLYSGWCAGGNAHITYP